MSNANDLRDRARNLRQAIPPRRESSPPEDTGQRLATVARSPDEELRVSWCTYEGRPYLSLRLWTRDDRGGWWPDSKKGITVRIRELADVAEAIAEALDLAEAAQDQYQHRSANRSQPPGFRDRTQPRSNGLQEPPIDEESPY